MGSGGGDRSTGFLSDRFSAKAGMGGTGGGAAAMVGLGGGERYGTAKERERRCCTVLNVGERGGEGGGSERDVDGGDCRVGLSELRDGVLDSAVRALWRRSPHDRAGMAERRGGGLRGM